MSTDQDERAEIEQLRAMADSMAAALAIALYDAHPTYGSAAGWRGGIGGQAITTLCSMIDPPPQDVWMAAGFDLLSTPLRDYLRLRSDAGFDLDAAKKQLEAQLRAALKGES